MMVTPVPFIGLVHLLHPPVVGDHPPKWVVLFGVGAVGLGALWCGVVVIVCLA